MYLDKGARFMKVSEVTSRPAAGTVLFQCNDIGARLSKASFSIWMTLPLLALVGLLMQSQAIADGNWGDAFANYSELSARYREGVDYRVRAINRSSPVVVLAIHGGKIEVGTTELAEQIAGSDLSFYTFEGLRPEAPNDVGLRPRRNGVLHLTSHHFDEPRAVNLVTQRSTSPEAPGGHLGPSEYCVSVHGFFEDADKQIACVGGGNAELRDRIAQEIRQTFPDSAESGADRIRVEVPCRRFGGTDPMNIANRCRQKGVQIELSHTLRRRVLGNHQFSERLADAIRNAALR